MLTLFYERVSTDRQAESGLGIEAQRKRNHQFAVMLGRPQDVDATYTDEGVSASVPFASRPHASSLMGRIGVARYGGEPESDIAVITYSLDRLFRDVDDGRSMFKWFDECGVKVYLSNEGGNSIDTSSAMGRFLVTIRLAQGELERGLTGERTKAALGALKARGGKIGAAPYGWASAGDAKHFPNPVEQAVVSLMLDLDNGNRSMRDIARILNDRGYHTRDGKDWTHVQIGRILQRAENEGE